MSDNMNNTVSMHSSDGDYFDDSDEISGSSFVDEDYDDDDDDYYDYHHDGEESNTGFSGGVEERDVREVQHLVQKETRHVQRWRCVVLLMLLAAAAAVTTLTYTSLQREDGEDFETSQELFAETIQTALTLRIESHLERMRSLSNRISSAGADDMPFVTIMNFEIDASSHPSTEQVAFLPFLHDTKELSEWTLFSEANYWNVPRHAVYNYANDDGDDGGEFFPVATTMDDDDDDASVIVPYAQISPPKPNVVNYNAMNQTTWFPNVRQRVAVSKESLLLPFEMDFLPPHQRAANTISPRGMSIVPILKRREDPSSEVLGLLTSVLKQWDGYFLSDIPLRFPGKDDVSMTLVLSCGGGGSGGDHQDKDDDDNKLEYTYALFGKGEATLVGEGDLHDAKYDHLQTVILQDAPIGCTWSTYPTNELASQYGSNTPLYLALIVAFAFGMMTLFFAIYEGFVRRQNSKILSAAAKFNKVVSSLFPSNLRNRLFGGEDDDDGPNSTQSSSRADRKSKRRSKRRKKKKRKHEKSLKAFLRGDVDDDDSNRTPADEDDKLKIRDEVDELMFKNKPIADLYTDTTILFADIVGFTAWSSVREPSQVFILLETLYRAFDQIAKKRRVFKVETVGDCYVAVTGLPDPRKDHAVVMARFAHDCLFKMKQLSHKLEVRLGPDTGDLSMRVGLHSGPVTAGVLRGERSRFQLFGDTMNTASRMESTGIRDRIQVSQETADLLTEAGKSRWLTKREDVVVAKGKGEMTTYWLENVAGVPVSPVAEVSNNMSRTRKGHAGLLYKTQSAVLANLEDTDTTKPVFSAKTQRLINWNVEVLRRLLKLIVARRNSQNLIAGTIQNAIHSRKMSLTGQPGGTVLDEVKEVINFPDFHTKVKGFDIDSIDLGEIVDSQIYEYVVSIAAMYRDNPFHNMDHASHVTMSVTKLLSRIVAPSSRLDGEHSDGGFVQDHTYGITADPLTQFACVFSALIHDVDHSGVPNTQLAKERPEFAAAYNNKAVAEQNSVDLAWLLLMDDQYSELCQTIYTNQAEKQRFRQLVVNSVMATDIMDKDLKQLRNARWEKAFSQKPARRSSFGPGCNRENVHRKATIVIEHLIQASDVAHTMQHWHIYRKWNERLFYEMRMAYLQGRSTTDPADNWYRGELGFFDYYIIPLAKKLKECGVFGVSSDEYLNYAEKNRAEWESRGQEVVAEMLESFRQQHEDVPESAPLGLQ